MLAEIRGRIAAAVQEAVRELTGEEVPPPPVEDPPRPEFGDLAVPVAMDLGRRLGRPPREVAEELVEHLAGRELAGVERWQVAGPGFLNVFLHRGYVLDELMKGLDRRQPPLERGDEKPKVLVEHTSINPNKAAHIGHLRNACLGDTLARVLRHQGHPVEVHNYIDDTGVQVADVVLGLMELRKLDAEGVARLADGGEEGGSFDYLCWDLYVEVTDRLNSDAGLAERRREVLVALERGEGEAARVAEEVVDRIVRRHLQTMGRLGIGYDLLVREGDIVALDLWAEVFERLRESPYVRYAEEGKHAGCWMMRLEGMPGFEDLEEADKVLVRSNGAATYVAKDIAYHLWKFGLLERTFRYRPFAQGPGHTVWQTTREGGEERPFGRADRAITVIDVRQAYLQAIVATALRALGAEAQAERLTHFAYEMVALSPPTAEALGIPLDPEGRRRPFVEMSGRRGHGVKADDLLDALVERATAEVAARNPDLDADRCGELGRQIATAAARFFLIKFTRNTVIVFDLDEALSFEGETGPYVQYAAVRADSIFEKIRDRWGVDAGEAVARLRGTAGSDAADGPVLPSLDRETLAEALQGQGHQELWRLVLGMARFEEAVVQAAGSMELAGLARYAFGLAQDFNRFYHLYPILQEEDPVERGLRLLVAYAFRERLSRVLELVGIPIPERM